MKLSKLKKTKSGNTRWDATRYLNENPEEALADTKRRRRLELDLAIKGSYAIDAIQSYSLKTTSFTPIYSKVINFKSNRWAERLKIILSELPVNTISTKEQVEAHEVSYWEGLAVEQIALSERLLNERSKLLARQLGELPSVNRIKE